MHGRFWVPKSIWAYLSVFAVLVGAWTAILSQYYHKTAVDAQKLRETAPFFDLNQTGNLGEWFLTATWFFVSIFSFMIVLLVLGRWHLNSSLVSIPTEINGPVVKKFAEYRWKARVLFWSLMTMISLAMSINTICRFFPAVLRRLAEQAQMLEIETEQRSLLVVCLITIGVTVGWIIVYAVWSYIQSVDFTKIILKCIFGLATIFLVSSIFFAYSIPTSSSPRSLTCISSPNPSESVSTKDCDEEENLPPEVHGISSAESDYQTISYSTASLACDEITIEAIFGRNVSFEEAIGCEKTVEECFHLEKRLELYLLDRLPKLSLVQAQTLLRCGAHGYFLVILALGLGFLARVERKEFDELWMLQTKLRMETPIGLPPRNILKDMYRTMS